MGYTTKESIVRADRFKGSGKYYDTIELDMEGFYKEASLREAVEKALIKQGSMLRSYTKEESDGFIVVLNPYHQTDYPVVVWAVI